MTRPQKAKEKYHLILIKPSKYDDDGYVISWFRGVITSNSLACISALSEDVRSRQVLGEDVEIQIHCFDETVQRIPAKKLARKIKKRGERGIVCLVGVQSNQFPRAVDIAGQFRKLGFPSIVGGFHVSGTMEMIPELTPDIKAAIDDGITVVAGEVEQRWGELVQAAYENNLKPIYNFLEDKPLLKGTPGPYLGRDNLKHFASVYSSFDAGRGCPFKCSFCTIINVQGNTMRGRAADDIEFLVRQNYAQGINHMFITDDNFARHPQWEEIADRLIKLRKEGIKVSFQIQTDTLAHKIPRFIEKLAQSGCKRVFIGLETVNPDNLIATGKRQNRLSEYRRMLQAWRYQGIVTFAGYIIGFPGDTYESIMGDVEYLKNELPLDFAEFFIMTPLPGSKDHQNYYKKGAPMDSDMNQYDTDHVCMDHPKMSREELLRAYADAWKSFYSDEHMFKLLVRRERQGGASSRVMAALVWFHASVFLESVHPLLGGFIRFKGRKTRRTSFPREAAVVYYPKRVIAIVVNLIKLGFLAWRIYKIRDKAKGREYLNYTDPAIAPDPPAETSKRVAAEKKLAAIV
jgi:radical SAM superfamily enzyme YgiQ (UPF0313 family)